MQHRKEGKIIKIVQIEMISKGPTNDHKIRVISHVVHA